MRTRKPKPKPNGTGISKAAGQPSGNSLSRVVELLVEHRIRLDALEHVLKETNPLAHDLYLGTIENLRARNAAEVNQVLSSLETQSRPRNR
jgi:hypothetical protein